MSWICWGSRKAALLNLLFVNREGFVAEVAIGGCLGHSGNDAVKFKIFKNTRKTACKILTLDMGRANFRLLRDLVMKDSWEYAF